MSDIEIDVLNSQTPEIEIDNINSDTPEIDIESSTEAIPELEGVALYGPQGPKGDKGDKGEQGIQGIQGIQGETGETGATGNGIVGLEKTGTSGLVDTYTLTYTNGDSDDITVTNGKDGQNGQDGINGTDGQDGFSPIATVEPIQDGAKITITDKDGTTTTNLYNGTDGTNGQDGAAATITVGTVTTGSAGSSASITNSGTTSAAVFDFVIPRGDKGETGSTGATGQDGFSPTATVTQSGEITTISITDKNGTTTESIDLSSYATQTDLTNGLATKQDTLIAGTDLEIVNATTPRLPAGYTELEYSESNKSPIDNIYTPTQNTEITTTFASQTESANFIANNSETDGVRYGFYYNTYWYYAIGKNMVSSGSSKDWGIGNWITVRMDRTGFYVNGTLVGSNVNTNNFTANPSITFARGTTAIVRWRSFIVRENGVLVMNLVPAKRNSDNVVGIYDTVSNTFLTTAGTGTFTGGPEVIYPTTTTINFTNESGYIKGIDSTDVTTALGYTPYNSSNPAGYTTNIGTVTSVNNTLPDVNGDVTLTIPTVNDGILTITQNGTSKGTFSANQSTNDTIALTDTTYNVFTGADGTNAGSSGLVPAPSATDNTKFLKGDGTWASVSGGSSTDVQINGTSITSQGVANIVTNTAYNASSNKIATMSDLPTDEIFIATYGTTTFNEVWTAYDAGKTVFVKDTTTVSGEIIAVLNYFEFNSALDAHFEFASSILNDYDYYTYSLDQDSIWSENTEQIPDTSGFEVTSNKVTSISSTSTDTQYPSAKVTYDSILKYNLIQDINTLSDGTIALNYVNSLHKRVVTANTTFTFSTSNLSLTNSIAYTFELLVTMSTVKTLTFPNSVTWQGGTTPTMSQAGTYYFAFRTVDAGTTWHGNLEGRW